MSNITDLFDTGVDSSGNILGDDVADPHYTLTSFPSGTVPPAVTVPAGYPFGVWIANTTTSKWIGPNTTSANGPVGSYTYETTFTLPTSFSTASITGEWATDDEGVNILLNGNSIGITNNKLFQLTSFTISNSSDFKAGTNTLDFVVKNDGGPTGLEVDNLVGNYSPGIANPTPVAKSDSYSLSENTTLTVPLATGVLANDSDPNGNPLTAVLVKKPSDGTVSFNPNGSFSYTPTTDFVGTDTFTYEDNNGNANSSPATVSLQVGLNLFDTGVDSAGNVLGDGVVDPHYTLTSFPSGAVPPATTVVNQYYGWLPNTTTSRWIGPDTSGANGPSGDYTFETTFTIPSGLSIASITGTWITDDNGVDILINGHSTKNTTVYDTATNFSISSGFVVGTNTLDFIVDNGPQNVGLQVENLVVNYSSIIANPTPIAKSDSYSLSKNTTLTVPLATGVLANDSDPNGNPLTAVLVSKPSDGTVSFNPDGSFTYTPTTDFVGTDTFTYEDNDGNSNSSPATVSLKISNVGVQTSLNTQTPGVATLSYTNVGLTSVAAPLFQIVTTNAQINSSYQNSSPTLAELLGLVIGLGGNNQPGLLPAGTLLQEYVPYTGQGDGPINLSVQPVSPDTVIDWAAIKTQLYSSPSYSFINSQAWNAIWTNFLNSVGNTYGSLQTALDQDANYLSSIGTPVTDISQLLQFELAKASNSLANTTIASTNDAFEAAPGLSLTFNRTFYNSLVDKDQVGSLGVGWSSEWDTHFSTDTNGNVTIYEDGGQRLFTKQSDGTYQSQTGDYGQLTLKQGQYVLQESDGTLYAFRSDNQRLDYVQDTNGNRITAGYTGALLTSLVQSNGESLTLSYNSQGDLSSITDSAGQTTTYSYDPSGQYLLSVTTPQGTTSYTYSNSSNPAVQNSLLSITNPDGTTESFSYNNQGLLAQQSGSGGVGQVSYTYNQGEVQATDALGNTTSTSVGTVAQASQVTNPLGNTVNAGYDSNYNLTSLTLPTGLTSTYQYDSNGNVITATDSLGNKVTATYTPTFNELQSLTDQKGNTTDYSYNTTGNLTGITYANGTSESYSYNSQGDVTQSINQNGSATSYTYNSQGLLLSTQYADGTSASYTYNQYGDMTSATNASGTELMTYNSANLLSNIIYSNGQSLSYSYNAGGQLTSMVDQSGFTTNYSYNAAGELAGTTDAQGNPIATYTYDADGNLTKQVNGNGTYTTYQYDKAGQVTQLTNYAADNSINSSFNYTYNSLGEQSSEATLDGTWTYQYDALGQLTNAVFASTNASVASQNLTYQYDAAGNRIQTINNGTTTNYTTNNVNQYTSVGTTTDQYDANGNLISQTQGGVTTTYTYNAQNQLTGVSDTSGNTWSYTYDALGNRISSTHNGQQTNYLVDPTGLGNVVGQYDSSGNLISNYTYGLGLTSQVSSNGSADYYDFNSQGSTVGLTGANGGSYLDSYSYSPFGENLSSTGTVFNPFQYVGEYGVSNAGNGLYFMGAREYDPMTGRFTQEDPIGLNGGDTNFYSYVGNSPTNAIDPTGLRKVGSSNSKGNSSKKVRQPKPAPTPSDKPSKGQILIDAGIGLIFVSPAYPPAAPVGLGTFIIGVVLVLIGDTHLTTLDSTHYNFQGAGEFTLVKSTTDDFEIQVRQQPWGGSTTVTVATAVSLELGGQRIGIYLNDPNPLKINGTVVNLADGGIYSIGTDLITRSGNSYNIRSANNDLIQVSLDGSYMGIGLALAANRQGKVVGLLGNDNGSTSDDFALRNGTVLGSSISNQELYGEYANSWRITQATSLFDYTTGQNTNTFTDLNFPPTVTTLNTLDPQAVATAKQIAQNAGITDPTLLQDAIYDLASTNNNTDFIQGYTTQQKALSLSNPNTITNLGGYGSQHWITGNAALPYTVNFSNNAAQGTTPVAQVTITEKLDPNLDLSTFALSNFGFEGNTYVVPTGVQNYSKQIDLTSTKGILVNVTAGLNTANGTVTWTFTSIDPTTGKPITDPTKGFLPPKDQTGGGSGYVGYTIQPKANITDGTVINSQAAIAFDSQTPTQTAAVFNTVEDNPPSSLVNPLPITESDPNFTVSWTGCDADSGIASYNVYVSTNSGQYVLWQNDTTATSATYNGQAGNTYAFYSVATDNAGLTEAAHAKADTTTTVDQPIILPLSSQVFFPSLAGYNQTLQGGLIDKNGLSPLIFTNQTNNQELNEIGIFTVDNSEGTINGIAPGNTSAYIKAALSQSQTIFSATPSNNVLQVDTKSAIRELSVLPSSYLGFYLIEGNTSDQILSDIADNRAPSASVLFNFTQPSSFQVTNANTSNNSLQLSFGSASNPDAVITVQAPTTAAQDIPVSQAAEDSPLNVLLDLRNVASSAQTFTVNSEAAYDDFVGYYQVDDTTGTITYNGKTYTPDQTGYAQAAIQLALGDSLGLSTGSLTGSGFKRETSSASQTIGGSYYAPFLITNGNIESFLAKNPTDNPDVGNAANGKDPLAYFAFVNANPDKLDHIRGISGNKIAFEDFYGLGDRDFNDVILQVGSSTNPFPTVHPTF